MLGDFFGLLGPLTIFLHLMASTEGAPTCTVDSPNQGVHGLPCADVQLTDGTLSFKVPLVNGAWIGTVSTDGSTLTGSWSQGTPQSLVFYRSELPSDFQPNPPPPDYDPAMPPAEPAELEDLLRADLKQALSRGILSSGKGIGVTVGVVTKSGRTVFALGAARPNQIFEIGSITKTFTGLILAQLIEQGKVTAGTPVRELLPAGVASRPVGNEITLLDLVTQHSGLPRLPDNLQPKDPGNPYVDYNAGRLLAYVRHHGVARPSNTGFLYSNLGFGLLGYSLTRVANEPYDQLITQQVLQPLHLSDTAVRPSPAQQARVLRGHTADLKPAQAWNSGALAGAGAVRSTAEDMLRYLQAQLDPEHLQARDAAGRTLKEALYRTHELQADVGPAGRISYAWMHETATGTYWHNGATGGYSSFAFFNPEAGYAGVVLVNMTLGAQGSFADALGQHIEQRLAGKPALSISNW